MNDLRKFLKERRKDITAGLKELFGEKSDDKAREFANKVWAFAFEEATGFEWENVNDPQEAWQAIIQVAAEDPELREEIVGYLDVDEDLAELIFSLAASTGGK